MSRTSWAPLRGIDQRQLSEARLQSHYAVQWLARVTRAYVRPQPDDGHTNLGWDGAIGCFTTHPLNDGAWLSLRITDLTLALHASAQNTHCISLEGRPDAHARQWLGEQLAARGLNAHALDAPSPYEMPAHAISQGAPYRPVEVTDALAELAAWFGNAALSLDVIQRQLIARKLASSPVRCWPHHFDLATLTTLSAQGTTGYVGVGLSPGDEYYDEPYFYVSVHPKLDPVALPRLPTLGYWHLRDFTGAIATARRIVAAKNQQVETDDFLQAAVHAAINVLR